MCTVPGLVVVAMAGQGTVVDYVAQLLKWPHNGEVCRGLERIVAYFVIRHKLEPNLARRWLVDAVKARMHHHDRLSTAEG